MNRLLPLEKTNAFSHLFIDYVNGKTELAPFYGLRPTSEAFEEAIRKKASNYQHREILVETLSRQIGEDLSSEQKSNLDKLSQPNCFTVTTGHQLSLATGPLYFIYKIVTTIKLAEELGKKYPVNQFVPVFWMASEDHDFEEVNHFYLFGKKYEWEREASGAVGRLSTEGVVELLHSVPDIPSWLKKLYNESTNLATATRKLVDYLFGKFGLLIIDGDDRELKRLMLPIIKSDLLEGKFSPKVRDTSQKLEDVGYKSQAFVRDHNFFYLKDTIRQRIERQGDKYTVVNTGISFETDGLSREIEEFPERFSPNVLLRPLYQEAILPNLAYVGGPGEIAYWLQLKELFDSQEIPFPILFPRNFVSIFTSATIQKMQEAGLTMENLFLEDNSFQQLVLDKLNVEKFDFEEEDKLLEQLKSGMLEKANKADKTLAPAAEAEIARITKSLTDFRKRLDKALENRHLSDINRLNNMRKKLLPEGKLQERHDNFLNFYINHPNLMDRLCAELDPFVFQMNCLTL